MRGTRSVMTHGRGSTWSIERGRAVLPRPLRTPRLSLCDAPRQVCSTSANKDVLLRVRSPAAPSSPRRRPTAHLGLPSPACSPLAGRTFRGHVLGVYGNLLFSPTQAKGAHWEDQHDSIARLFVAQANENGLAADYELTDAFIGVIPRARRHAFYVLRRSTQHSTTPDARVQLARGDDAYYDAKTCEAGCLIRAGRAGLAAICFTLLKF